MTTMPNSHFKLSKRHKLALNMRETGATFTEIARILGVSNSRASLIVKEAEAELRYLEMLEELKNSKIDFNTTISQIPTFGWRLKEHLSLAGIVTLKDILRTPKKDLLKIDNFHKTPIKELEATLHALGYRLKD